MTQQLPTKTVNTTIKRIGSQLEISNGQSTYRIDGDTPARNCFGNETGNTVMEEFEDGYLVVAGEDTGMMYGTVYAV